MCPRVEVTVKDGNSLWVPCLMFADDVVFMAGSEQEMAEQMKHVDLWAEKWEMEVNVSKSGVMLVTDSDERREEFQAKEGQWKLRGRNWPVVDRYVYLGNMMTNRLDLDECVRYRAKKGQAALAAMLPFLRNSSIPVTVRALLVKVVVMPSALYGAELWAMSMSRVNPIQKLVIRAIRAIVGHRVTGVSSIHGHAVELGIPPAHLWERCAGVGCTTSTDRWSRDPWLRRGCGCRISLRIRRREASGRGPRARSGGWRGIPGTRRGTERSGWRESSRLSI